MRNYEVTFIVDPVLSGDEIKTTAQTYVDRLQAEGCTIVHVDEMGLRALAYPINRRSSGVYFCVEFQTENASFLTAFELSLKRDERILRFLAVQLDKYGVKYNDDKRKGLIGSKKKRQQPERGAAETVTQTRAAEPAPAKTEAPAKAEAKVEAPAKAEAPVKEEAKVEAPAPAKAEAPAEPAAAALVAEDAAEPVEEVAVQPAAEPVAEEAPVAAAEEEATPVAETAADSNEEQA